MGRDDLYNFSYKKYELEFDKENFLFLKSGTKFCPLCLKCRIHQDFTWGVNLVSVCIEHKVFLLDKCPSCKMKVTLNSLFNDKCTKCFRPFSEMNTVGVEEDLILESQKELNSILINHEQKFLDLIELKDLLIVLSGFSQLFHGVGGINQTKLKEYKIDYANNLPFDQETFMSYIADVYWIFKDFNKRFITLLEASFKQEVTRETRKRRQNFVDIINSSDNLRFILKVYHQWRVEHCILDLRVPKNISSYDKHTSEYLAKNFFTKSELKEKFSVTEAEFVALAESGSLNGCQFHAGGVIYLKREETKKVLNTFLLEKDDKVTATEAADILGVHLDRVFSLIKNGTLSYSIYLGKEKFLSKRQLYKLLDSLKVEVVESLDGKINTSDCFKKYSTSGLSLSQLIDFNKTCGMTAYVTTRSFKICDLFFNLDELSDIIEEYRINAKGYNLRQVSKELVCTERTVLKFVEAGLLASPIIERLNNKAFAYRFLVEDIQAFKRTYCSVQDVVKEFNVSETLVRNAIYRKSIKNYLSGICRKTLIKKSEFESYYTKEKDH